MNNDDQSLKTQIENGFSAHDIENEEELKKVYRDNENELQHCKKKEIRKMFVDARNLFPLIERVIDTIELIQNQESTFLLGAIRLKYLCLRFITTSFLVESETVHHTD